MRPIGRRHAPAPPHFAKSRPIAPKCASYSLGAGGQGRANCSQKRPFTPSPLRRRPSADASSCAAKLMLSAAMRHSPHCFNLIEPERKAVEGVVGLIRIPRLKRRMDQRPLARRKQNLLRANKMRRRAQRRQQLPIELRDARAALQSRHAGVAHFPIFRKRSAHALRILRVNAARIVREQFFNPIASFDASNTLLERGAFRKIVSRRPQYVLLDFLHRKPSFRRFLHRAFVRRAAQFVPCATLLRFP